MNVTSSRAQFIKEHFLFDSLQYVIELKKKKKRSSDRQVAHVSGHLAALEDKYASNQVYTKSYRAQLR